MAGTYTQPPFVMPQPWHQPAMGPAKARSSLSMFPPGRRWVQAVGAPIPGEIAGLGVLEVQRELTPGQYAAGSLLGATVGGAVVGYVSSGSTEGGTTGALFTAGLAALADAVVLGREGHQVVAMGALLAGVGGLGGALYRMSRGGRQGGTLKARR